MESSRVQIVIIHSSPPCAKCIKAKKIALEMVEKYGPAVSLKELDAMEEEADAYGVLMTPTTIVNDIVLAVGRAPDPERTERLIREMLGVPPAAGEPSTARNVNGG